MMIARLGSQLRDLILKGTTDAMAEASRPIVRGYLALAMVYYAAMVPVHFYALSGIDQIQMMLVSFAAAIVAGFGWWMSRESISSQRLEVIAATTNLMVYANVMLAVHVSLDPSNLVYFPALALAFAFTSVSMRVAAGSIAVVLISLYIELATCFVGEGLAYAYIGFATGIGGLGLVVFLRQAIWAAIQAKEAAEGKLVEAEKLNDDMRERAMSDSLTGLPNRRAFFSLLEEKIEEPAGANNDWLVALDLDGFKMVNDVYGHIVGDKLLIAVSNRMQELGASRAMVSRIGGDEFSIILNGVDEAQCEEWCTELLEKIAQPYDVEGRLIQLSASVGCTHLDVSKKMTVLVRNADYALLHAKKHGKNRVVVFTSEHEKNAKERFEIEDALRTADFPAEIEVLFQPQVDLSQRKIIRAEALARWQCPKLGRIQPDRFIEVAEESGLISKITLAVLDKAIAALKSWENPVPLAINLSGHDLLSNQVMDEIVAVLEKSDLDPALLEFEVTETAMMADTEKACNNLKRLSALGYSVALDDFGTGYSNFNYLRELPIDKLKVDRSFVEDIGNPMTEKILHSLTVTASALGVDCLLEGVEDELQLLTAKRVGAHSVQGYFFGKPMEGDQLTNLIEEENNQKSKAAG